MTFWKHRNFWWTVAAVFGWIFLSDFIIHGKILSNTYMETAGLWRSQEDMQSKMIWMMLGQFGMAFWMCWIYPHGAKNNNSTDGLRFGLWIGFFNCMHYFIQYSTTPMPASLLWSWFAFTMLQAVVSGWIVWKIWSLNPKLLKLA